jgi:D-alanyl-D-alanine endopeptidase (penicillin-binding protein 7)
MRLLVTILLCVVSTFASAKSEPARAVLIFDQGVKEETNIHKEMGIASITKLMTVYVVLESHASLDELITITPHKIETSHALRTGMSVTRRELITMSLVASDNLAARMLAESHPQGYEMFIEEMNATARKLNMSRTNFIEPTGLLLNTSTAWDLHLLNRAVKKYSVFSDSAMSATAITSATNKKGLWQRLVIRNTSAFAGAYDLKVGKTGYTNPAGWCISMTVKHKDREFDIIVLGSPSKQARNSLVASKLKNYMNSITASAIVKTIDLIEDSADGYLPQ